MTVTKRLTATLGPLSPVGSSSSQHRRTPELVLNLASTLVLWCFALNPHQPHARLKTRRRRPLGPLGHEIRMSAKSMNLLCIFVSFFDRSKWAGLGAGEREWGVEESYSGARNRSRCAQSLILLSARVSLLLRSSTAGYAPPVRASFRRGVGLSLADRARTQALNLSVKPSGWVPQSSAAASALQLPPRLGSGSVFTICRKLGQAWGSSEATSCSPPVYIGGQACMPEPTVGRGSRESSGSHPLSAIAPDRSVSCADMASCSLRG